MNDTPTATDPATDEEIAVRLTQEEGRPVSVSEVRAVTMRALVKLRGLLKERGISSAGDLVPGERGSRVDSP